MPASLVFLRASSAFPSDEHVCVLGSHFSVSNNVPEIIKELPEGVSLPVEHLNRLLALSSPSSSPSHVKMGTLASDGKTYVHLLTYSNTHTRLNIVSRPDCVFSAAHSVPRENCSVIVALENENDALPASLAFARALPMYSQKKKGKKAYTLSVRFVPKLSDSTLEFVANSCQGVRLCSRLVDMPCCEINTVTFIDEVARAIGGLKGVKMEVLRGVQLRELGYGGIWNVGRAAELPPALVTLSYEKEASDDKPTYVFVGKGIVYDSGGLALKSRTSMFGMKRDMAGAAAVLSAFISAVKNKCEVNLHAVLPLAENAIGSKAYRHDDIIKLFSGKTVEINNTDAEGRLVLADGVAHAERYLSPDIVITIATLTGAQGIATGKHFAALIADNSELESEIVSAGKRCGELVFPLPYCPELFEKEFNSAFADCRNSVNCRTNAQVSCAAHFVGSNFSHNYGGKWAHLDIAYPADSGDYATGFGAGLLMSLVAKSPETTEGEYELEEVS